tara:strand:- start:689 stop:904 length:216 start_codon:yes stop_codon:yes gene_type:complete
MGDIASLGLRLLKLAGIVLFLIFFIRILDNIFFFMGFSFESYAIYLFIMIVVMLFIGILPDRKYQYGIFFK